MKLEKKSIEYLANGDEVITVQTITDGTHRHSERFIERTVGKAKVRTIRIAKQFDPLELLMSVK